MNLHYPWHHNEGSNLFLLTLHWGSHKDVLPSLPRSIIKGQWFLSLFVIYLSLYLDLRVICVCVHGQHMHFKHLQQMV
jgi:hypothetical protein